MNCSTLGSQIDAAAVAVRPDLEGLGRHLEGCAACRERFPEIAAWMAAALPGVASAPERLRGALPERRWRRAAAAVILVAACGGAWWGGVFVDEPLPVAPGHHVDGLRSPDAAGWQDAPAPVSRWPAGRKLPPSASSMSFTIERHERGRILAASVTDTWEVAVSRRPEKE